jgi:hypothetical protein
VLAVLVWVVGLVGVGAPGVARGAAKRSIVLEIASAQGDWRAEALAQALSADLADDRLAPRPPPCTGPCSDAALRAAGVELVARAALAPGPALRYELRALWPGGPPPLRGAIALGALDRAALAGLLRDQLQRMARATTGDTAADAQPGDRPGEPPAADLPALGGIALALGVALAVLALPIAIGSLAARRLIARAAALRTLVGACGLGALAAGLAALAPVNGRGALLAAGGLAWGAFAAVTLPVVLTPLVGLGRSDYRELGRLLAGWVGLALRRALAVAVLYAPVVLGAIAAGDAADAALGTGEAVRFALVLPLALLTVRQALRLAIAAIAEWLDARLADPSADAAAWQDAVRDYLVGYLRRNDLALDRAMLDRLVVFPSVSGSPGSSEPATGDAVRVYGGGATATRIAIPRRMLELALAPWGRPHDYAAPRVSTLHWTQWNAGLVMATEPGAVVASREQRQPRTTTSEGDPSANARIQIGEPPTSIGVIEPYELDPRSSYRPHDDPAWLDWEGEDYDGTDPGDRDFLFGALAHAIAAVQRHADRIDTLAVALIELARPARAGSSEPPGRLRRLAAALGRQIARADDEIADDHTAISGALHHLAQHLGWEAWQREDLLTARAYAPELEAMSRRLLALAADSPSRALPSASRARRRLAHLAGLIPATAARPSRWRRLALAGALAAGLGAAVLAVVDAVRFHAVYAQRAQLQATHDTETPDHGKN